MEQIISKIIDKCYILNYDELLEFVADIINFMEFSDEETDLFVTKVFDLIVKHQLFLVGL